MRKEPRFSGRGLGTCKAECCARAPAQVFASTPRHPLPGDSTSPFCNPTMRSARRENSIQLVVHGAKILLLSSQLRQQPLQDSTCFFYASRTSVDRIAFDQRHGQSDKVSWSRVTPKSSISQNLAMTTSLPAVAAYLQIVEPARSVATKAMIDRSPETHQPLEQVHKDIKLAARHVIGKIPETSRNHEPALNVLA